MVAVTHDESTIFHYDLYATTHFDSRSTNLPVVSNAYSPNSSIYSNSSMYLVHRFVHQYVPAAGSTHMYTICWAFPTRCWHHRMPKGPWNESNRTIARISHYIPFAAAACMYHHHHHQCRAFFVPKKLLPSVWASVSMLSVAAQAHVSWNSRTKINKLTNKRTNKHVYTKQYTYFQSRRHLELIRIYLIAGVHTHYVTARTLSEDMYPNSFWRAFILCTRRTYQPEHTGTVVCSDGDLVLAASASNVNGLASTLCTACPNT